MTALVPVKSSNVKAVGYDAARSELHVEFHDGGVHVFEGVPAIEHAALMSAPSVGGHLHARVRGKYRSRKHVTRA